MAAYRAGRLEEAAGEFARAEAGFAQQGDHLQRAEMANNRAVVLLALERPSEARAAVAGTEAVFLAAGDQARAGKALGNLAAALEGENQWGAAESAYRRAITCFTEAGDDESRAHTLQALSRLHLRRGRPLEAVAAMDAGLEARPAGLSRRFLRWLIALPSRFLGR
jgi:tetratricopeptide (TPR) repeat protein